MEVFLPIAQVFVNPVEILFLSAIVGVLSGLFGVGGGFLMTPFLIFLGVPPAYAVANEANNILATSVSGSLTHWFKNTLDYKMGFMIMCGGVIGTLLGIMTFTYFSEIGKISRGENTGYFSESTWNKYSKRIIAQAKGLLLSSTTNDKMFDKPKKSIGEQSLVAIVDSFDGLRKVIDVEWNHLISNLKGFTNIISETPLEIDELFYYQQDGKTTVVPIEVKGIKETLNLSKIFQQFQAFRLKLNYRIELRIFALTEVIPETGISKQIELIEFEVNEELIDAKEGQILLDAINSVNAKRRYSFRLK